MWKIIHNQTQHPQLLAVSPQLNVAYTAGLIEPPTKITPIKKSASSEETTNEDSDTDSYGSKKQVPTLMHNPKIITRNVTRTTKAEDGDQKDKVVHVMENIYETVHTRDTNVSIREGLLLPIQNGQGESHFVITKITNKKAHELTYRIFILLLLCW